MFIVLISTITIFNRLVEVFININIVVVVKLILLMFMSLLLARMVLNIYYRANSEGVKIFVWKVNWLLALLWVFSGINANDYDFINSYIVGIQNS